jgi:hypothetical protein
MNHSRNSLLVATRSKVEWLAGKLSRVTSSGDLIPEIDGLRFIAISTVVFHHLLSMYLSGSGRSPEVRTPAEWFAASDQSWLVILAYCGHFGVNLFFVISGFILALPFAKRAFSDLPAPDLKGYYLRRVTRIEPPYLLSLIVIFLIHFGQNGEGLRLPDRPAAGSDLQIARRYDAPVVAHRVNRWLGIDLAMGDLSLGFGADGAFVAQLRALFFDRIPAR